ncbi:MAG: chemotaxis response regulator protein-glutamate methylesterase [Verrucomicrobiota bacterium]
MLFSKTKVLIVDDSAIVRQALAKVLSRRSGIEVVGAARDAYEAKEQILRLKPDVLLLDIDMPRMDGITFIKILMQHHPMPVVVLSYLTRSGSNAAMECAQAGAIEVMPKPSSDHEVAILGDELAMKLKAAASAKIRRPSAPISTQSSTPQNRVFSGSTNNRQLILMGASTGGTEALKELLAKLPANLPPILIVQHIPPEFSKAFADRVNKYCPFKVKEAENGEIARPSHAYVAPGDYHMLTDWQGSHYQIKLNQGPSVWHQRPAVDTLFKSAAEYCDSSFVAALLTGMGKDGAEGMKILRERGAYTIGQDEETSAVYGMPKAAMEAGGVVDQLPLDKISDALLKHLRSLRSPRLAGRN